MAELADLVDNAQTRAQAPPMSKTPLPQPTVAPSSIDDTPTEPATSPRIIDPHSREWPLELQLPTREIGPREELERYPTKFIVNDGQWTPEGHEEELRKASQAGNFYAWNREAREEAERHNQEFARSMAEWQAQVESRGFKDHPSVPHGPPPKRTSSMRALPDVHDALRQNDPSKAPVSQPILPKKAPPTTGRGRPAAFYSGDEPPRIGSAPVQPPPLPKPSSMSGVQPQGVFHPPTATPTTPGHPPRPPIEALPKPVPEAASQATLEQPLPQPAQQGPPNKQVRHKAFPYEQQASSTMSMASPSAIDMSRMSAPRPKGKGPPAFFMPTPGDVQHCHHVQPQLIQMSVAESIECDPHLTSIGIIVSMNNLNPTSRMVHGIPHCLKICACSAGKSSRWTIMASISFIPQRQHHLRRAEDDGPTLHSHA